MAEVEPMVIPAFPSEAEEAAWWDSHQAMIEERFLRAAASGALGQGRVAKQAVAGKKSGASPTLTLRVPESDISRAQRIAVSDILAHADSRGTWSVRNDAHDL